MAMTTKLSKIRKTMAGSQGKERNFTFCLPSYCSYWQDNTIDAYVKEYEADQGQGQLYRNPVYNIGCPYDKQPISDIGSQGAHDCDGRSCRYFLKSPGDSGQPFHSPGPAEQEIVDWSDRDSAEGR